MPVVIVVSGVVVRLKAVSAITWCLYGAAGAPKDEGLSERLQFQWAVERHGEVRIVLRAVVVERTEQRRGVAEG